MQAGLDKRQCVGESRLWSVRIRNPQQFFRAPDFHAYLGISPHLTELEQWPTGCWMTETHGEDRTLTKAGRLDHPAGACAENRLAAKSRVRPSPGATDAPAKQGPSSGAE